MAPVCAPALLRGDGALRGPGDLERQVLLHPNPDRRDWRRWLAAAGLSARLAERGQVFPTLDLATSAAAGGLGVAMADLHLVEEELADGRLVAPLQPVLRDGIGYVLLAEAGRLAEPRLAVFSDWLTAELAAVGIGGRP